MKKNTFLLLVTLLSTTSWAQCIVPTNFGTGVAENDGSIITINTCTQSGEYNNILSLTVGNDYEFTNTLNADGSNHYITITSGSNVVIANGLSPLTVTSIPNGTVRLHVTTDAACSTTPNPDCHTTTVQCVSTSCVPANPPGNDICATAEVAPVGSGVCGADVTGTNIDATNSGVNQAACALVTYSGGDIWYEFSVPTGETVVNYSRSASAFSSTQVELFSGSCGALTEVDCTIGDTYSFTGLTSGTTYYLRIYDWGNDDIGDVTFCLSTPNTLSTSSFETNSIFNYYPNPVKNTLSLNAKEAITNVLIFNILGREVVKINTNTVSKNVDMSSLKSGIYFVQVTIGETVETVRIIKN